MESFIHLCSRIITGNIAAYNIVVHIIYVHFLNILPVLIDFFSHSIRVKDDKIRLLEEQLQCEISNKMEEFKVCD